MFFTRAWNWTPHGVTDGVGSVDHVTPSQVKEAIAQGKEDLLLLDVREPYEYSLGHLPGAKLIPLKELPQRVGELDPGRWIVVYCRSGHRSLTAGAYLKLLGFSRVENLQGGILAWAAGYSGH